MRERPVGRRARVLREDRLVERVSAWADQIPGGWDGLDPGLAVRELRLRLGSSQRGPAALAGVRQGHVSTLARFMGALGDEPALGWRRL